MLNLPQQTLDRIKSVLTRQQKRVDDELKSIEKEDPMLAEALPESSESGTDSWQADVHSRLISLKKDLFGLSKKISRSLTNLRNGSYGKCESCGKSIEPQRLEAMPTAVLCLSCSKKSTHKG